MKTRNRILSILSLVVLALTGCGLSLGGGTVVVGVECDPPVSVTVAVETVQGAPDITVWRYDFSLEKWLDNVAGDSAQKGLVPILVAAAAAQCEDLSAIRDNRALSR